MSFLNGVERILQASRGRRPRPSADIAVETHQQAAGTVLACACFNRVLAGRKRRRLGKSVKYSLVRATPGRLGIARARNPHSCPEPPFDGNRGRGRRNAAWSIAGPVPATQNQTWSCAAGAGGKPLAPRAPRDRTARKFFTPDGRDHR